MTDSNTAQLSAAGVSIWLDQYSSVVNTANGGLFTGAAYSDVNAVIPGRAILAEEHREVLAALDRLAPRQREVLVLRYWSGLSEAEIADACGISRGSVKSTASRAIDALEQIMQSTSEETR